MSQQFQQRRNGKEFKPSMQSLALCQEQEACLHEHNSWQLSAAMELFFLKKNHINIITPLPPSIK